MNSKMLDLLKAANVEDILRSLRKGKFVDTLRVINRARETLKGSGTIVLLQGSNAMIRWKVAGYLIGKEVGLGKTAYAVDFNEYVEAHFLPTGQTLRQTAKSTEALWIKWDFPRNHAWGKTLFQGLLFSRTSQVTIVTVPIDIIDQCEGLTDKVRIFDLSKVEWVETIGTAVSDSKEDIGRSQVQGEGIRHSQVGPLHVKSPQISL